MDHYGKKGELEYVYQATPETVRKTLEGIPSATNANQSLSLAGFKEAVDFVHRFIDQKTTTNKQEIPENLKKNFSLKNNKPLKKDKQKLQKRNQLTSIEKRKLGLHKLPKSGLTYESFTELHKLWKEYMESFLDLNMSTTGSNQDQLNTRLAKADYHGCLLMVSRSKCPSHIGLKGIVIMETKNTFQIICPDNKLKIIPKRGNVFTFTLDDWTFTLFGNQFNIRPSERASRKFKSRNTVDL